MVMGKILDCDAFLAQVHSVRKEKMQREEVLEVRLSKMNALIMDLPATLVHALERVNRRLGQRASSSACRIDLSWLAARRP